MIELPPGLSLKRNQKAEAGMLEKARTWLETEERSPGIHASDLLDLRIAYWSRVKPAPLSDRLVTMFLIGKVLHAFVINAVTGSAGLASGEATQHSTDLGITFTPDLVINGVVNELKTSRQFFEPKNTDDLGHYIEQLLVYMAATQTTRSRLWVLLINLRDAETRKTAPAFRCYDIRISDEELVAVTDAVRANRVSLEAALTAGDHRSLPLCREWKCGATNCQWWEDCKPEGRYK